MSAARRLRRQLGNHAPKVMRLAREANLTPGTVNEVRVFHDTHCSLLRGAGPCDCDPDVELVPVPGVRSN